MKVLITGHGGEPLSNSKWWYAEHIGEIFDVEPDKKPEEYFSTVQEHKGEKIKHHIRKVDCEIVPDESTAYGTDCRGGCDT